MRHLFLTCCLALTSTAAAQDVPTREIKKEDLVANFATVRAGWLEVDRTPPHSLSSILFSDDADEAQRKVDTDVGIVVSINPESRVKVQRGPAAIKVAYGWPTPVLVKVINEAGVTATLNGQVTGDAAITARFFEFTSPGERKEKLTPKLSGRAVEYQLLLLRSTVMGRREIQLSFDVGQATQDLGNRALLPVLAETAKGDCAFFFDKRNLLSEHDQGGWVMTEKDPLLRWELRKSELKDAFQGVAGDFSTTTQPKRDLDIQVVSEVTLDKVIRRSITYKTADGDRVPAYVLLPRERKGKLPAVLCLHQTTRHGKAEPAGVGGLKNLHYALELAARGYITLAPDYPGYGDNTKSSPYQIKHAWYAWPIPPPARHMPVDALHGGWRTGAPYASMTAKGIANHRTALDVLQSLPEVDPLNIGCIGHSLGGHNTLFVSLFDDRIKVLATSCGFCSFSKYMGGNLAGWSHKGYMPRIASVYQNDPKQMPFDFTEILAAMAPRPVFINAPLKDDNFAVDGVKDCVKAALPVYKLLGKPEHLVVEHPDCGHDFPPEVRERCYQFFDRYLRDRAASK
jgi:dienelactone hydrolase